MVRSRMFIVLGGCFLMASAAWADGVAYIDCAAHPEDTQVFPKPRRMPESVAGLPCGERFTVLLNGFIFSRIQTKDGQIGYIYSNLISPDRSGASVPSPTSARVNAAPAKATNPAVQPPATVPAQAQAVEAPTTQIQAIPAQPKPAQAPAWPSE